MAFRPTFMTFGDSITQRGFASPGGWTGLLADAYQRRADIINRGYSGYNTAWALKLLPHVLPRPTPSLATVWFGANDAALPDRSSSRQHVPVQQYVSNTRAIVHHLQRAGVRAIVLITPPPISEPHRIAHVQQTYGLKLDVAERTNEVAGQYAEALQALASELGLPCLNVWSAFQQEQGWADKLLCDGLHLTPEGNALVYSLLQQLINKRFPDLGVEALPFDAPDHSAIDPLNVPNAFKKHFSQQQNASTNEEL